MTIPMYQASVPRFVNILGNLSNILDDGTEEREIVTARGDKETRYKGMQFLLGHAVPNLYFHVTTVYNILRHSGIEIGKRDYLDNP